MGVLDRLRGPAHQATAQAPARLPQRPSKTATATALQRPTVGLGDERHVVGEASYQDALEWAAQGRTEDGCLVQHVIAELVLEPTNPYDGNAVRVDVGGKTVGYIPRNETGDYRALVAHLWSHDYLATCRARLTGGWLRSYNYRGHIGICLDAGDRPTTATPDTPTLPLGPRLTVTCEEHYQVTLQSFLGMSERAAILGTLTRAESNPHKKESGACVRVSISGETVGYLTPAMSERFLPLVAAMEQVGLPATCGGTLKRTEKQIEVRLEAAHPDCIGL